MKHQFIEWNPTSKTTDTLLQAITVIEEYYEQGYTLTLRGVFYQLERRGMIQKTDDEYDRLGYILKQGRLAGLIDWAMIVDHTRKVERQASWYEPKEFLKVVPPAYHLDRWDNQEHRLVVMVEKDTLRNIILPTCEKYDVPFCANRGYASLSHLYKVAGLFSEYYDAGQSPILFYLGDHDPSGLDMDRDIVERIEKFVEGESLNMVRLAITMEQINSFQLSSSPTKVNESRAELYVEEYGDESWELESLEPSVLADLVEDAIKETIDFDRWEEVEEKEKEDQNIIQDFLDTFEE